MGLLFLEFLLTKPYLIEPAPALKSFEGLRYLPGFPSDPLLAGGC
jgi:hypothetical protein